MIMVSSFAVADYISSVINGNTHALSLINQLQKRNSGHPGKFTMKRTAKSEDLLDAEVSSTRDDLRGRIMSAAIILLTRGGRNAVTTRALADAADVQAPALYRLYCDKDGVLDAVAEHGFASYLAKKKFRKPSRDPVEELRIGWDLHVEFGLSNPAIYLLMYADPRPGKKTPAAEASHQMLCAHVRRIAEAGRLRVSEARAACLVHASACGIVLTLLATAEDHRDMRLSEIAREATLAAITTAAQTLERPGPATAAVALRAMLSDVMPLSGAERTLLAEWLDRLATSQPQSQKISGHKGSQTRRDRSKDSRI
jgi:AcrR family transcriptional regulator